MEHENFFENLQEFNSKYSEVLNLLIKKKFDNASNPFIDVLGVQKAYIDAVSDFTNNPSKFFQHNMEYASKVSNLMFHFMDKMNDEEKPPLYESSPRDRRFKDKAWKDSIYFNFVKQFYLMSSDWYRSLVDKLDVPESKKKLLDFYTEHMLNASSPTNFINSNPEVLNELVNTNGKNLIQGIENFIEDLKKSENFPNISTSRPEVFELGKNIASTEGKIIYQNELMQLIHYKPKDITYQVPIFILPPWINKYYILDLSKENSYVNYLVESGFEVFLVSWVNPGPELFNKSFEDYLDLGVLENIEFLKDKMNIENLNLIGYCLGGTLATCANSYLNIKKNNPFISTTYLTTMIDFADPGDLGLFINEQTIEAIKDELKHKGYFSGKYMSYAFSLLRANELIWSFVVNNYLLGKKPITFDLLYWNSDSTNLPASMHSFYLENMYVKNNLVKKNKVSLLDVKIDISNINQPSFFLSAQEDHIAPWESTYTGAELISNNENSNTTFCLAGSGHIAGVINPPEKNKYSYFINKKIESDPIKWLENATEAKGSWWDYWREWVVTHSGDLKQNDNYNKLPSVEVAPGSYVKNRII